MRKTHWLPLLTAVCGFSSPLRADVTLVQHVEGMGQNMDTTMMIKASRVRIDASPAASMIMDLNSGVMISLMHVQRNYTKVWGMKQTPGMPNPAGLSLAPTGKKDMISGYAADEYIVTAAGKKMTMWLTKAAPDYTHVLKEMSAAFAQGPMPAMIQGIEQDMATLPGFPVRTVNEFQPGQTITRTVVSISANPIADSEFAIPAGYTQMTMPSFNHLGPGNAKPASQ